MFIMLHHVYNASSVCLKYDTKFRLLIKIFICLTYTDFRKLKAVIPNMEYNHKQNSVATTRLHDAISQKALILCILPVLLQTFTSRQVRRDMFLTFSPRCPIWAFLAAWATHVCVVKMSGVPFEPNNHTSINWFSFAVYLTTLAVA
jgi:hypothetical protein